MSAFVLRQDLAQCMRVPPERVRVLSGDVHLGVALIALRAAERPGGEDHQRDANQQALSLHVGEG